jgi:hypothetical protein
VSQSAAQRRYTITRIEGQAMLRHSLSAAAAGAVALAAIAGFTRTDPPSAGERALLGRTAAHESVDSNLRMARPEGRVSAGRALLGEPTASERLAVPGEAIQIRPRRSDGQGALLGRP